MPICLSCGLTITDGALAVELSADAGNALECRDDGLYTAGADISADACNAISAHADGLWAPCQRGLVGTAQMDSPQNAALPITITGATEDDYNFNSDVVTITNDTCRAVTGTITIQVGGLFADSGAAGFYADAGLEVNIAGGGFNPSTPNTIKRVFGASNFFDFNNIHEINFLGPLAAGASVTYQANLKVTAHSGDASLHGAVNFAFQWVLVPTAAC